MSPVVKREAQAAARARQVAVADHRERRKATQLRTLVSIEVCTLQARDNVA
jgi:hypothetical protein